MFWLCISPSSWLLCCDQSALLPFVPPSHFRHTSCCLNMCHHLWGRRECLAALGFPRAALVPLQQSSPAIALWELRGGKGQSPWALVGKGMGIKKWTKHCREQNIRVAGYIAGLYGSCLVLQHFCLIFVRSRLILMMRTCLSLNIGSKEVLNFDNFPLARLHGISATGRSTGLQWWEMYFFSVTLYHRIVKCGLGENLDKPFHHVLIWKCLYVWWFILVFRSC